MWRWSVSPEAAPDVPEYIELKYKGGDIVAINGKSMTPAQVLTELNRLGGKHGVGRIDIVENRYVGMKSRGCYETPGGTIMLTSTFSPPTCSTNSACGKIVTTTPNLLLSSAASFWQDFIKGVVTPSSPIDITSIIILTLLGIIAPHCGNYGISHETQAHVLL